jgi:hypothetical protein
MSVRSSLSLHLSLPNAPENSSSLQSTLRIASEQGVSHLWLNIRGEEDLKRMEELCAGFSLEAVAISDAPEGCMEAIRRGARGVAVRPEVAKLLLGEVEEGGRRPDEVYLCMEEMEGRDGTDAGYVALQNEAAALATGYREAGVERVYVQLQHPDPVLQFNVLRRMKERFGVRHIISLDPGVGGERELLKNAVSLGSLLYEGVGDAVLLRPSSVSDEGVRELLLRARKILGSCRLLPTGYTIISCPTCGRCRLDLLKMTGEIDRRLRLLSQKYEIEGKRLEQVGGIAVAVMGCNVNGPGEARNADIGIAGRKNRTGILFKNGKPFKTLPEHRLVDELIDHTKELIDDKFQNLPS